MLLLRLRQGQLAASAHSAALGWGTLRVSTGQPAHWERSLYVLTSEPQTSSKPQRRLVINQIRARL